MMSFRLCFIQYFKIVVVFFFSFSDAVEDKEERKGTQGKCSELNTGCRGEVRFSVRLHF